MKAIVLAAGKGTRIIKKGDDFPKAMKPLLGKPLLGYVLDSLSFLPKKDITVVVGYRREKITEAFGGYNFVVQEQQLGTGHAVKVCEESFAGYDGPVLITLGDMPMIRPETFQNAFRFHRENNCDCTILTGSSEFPLPYGRVIRGKDGEFERIVEQRDCTPEQLLIRELNPSIYVFEAAGLFPALGRLRTQNAQGEYYLTDAPQLMKEQGMKVMTYFIGNDSQILGVNNEEDLARCAALLS